jgi:L-fuconolactonase
MRRIDCHMHFWTLGMGPYYSLWMSPDLKTLYGDYLPRDAQPLMATNDVQGVVLVSAASSIHETGYLMGLADSQDFIRGVVAWVDMLAPKAVDDLRGWARFRKLKSIRPYLQDLPEDDWILKPQLDPAIKTMLDLGLRFDALIKPRHILNTVKFIERYPTLPVIVNHMAKPAIRDNGFEPWRRDMEQFRDLEHVHCKISRVLTEDVRIGRSIGLDHISRRSTTSSDQPVSFSEAIWPVVNLVADYSRWIETLSEGMSGLDARRSAENMGRQRREILRALKEDVRPAGSGQPAKGNRVDDDAFGRSGGGCCFATQLASLIRAR